MNRYNMVLLVRVDPDTLCINEISAEQQIKTNITAADEVLARRAALEQAWDNHLVVSRFLAVKERKLK